MRLFNKRIKYLLKSQVILLSCCLTGCMGIYEDGFECPAEKGVGCKSISEVNHMVDRSQVSKSSCSQYEKNEIWYAPSAGHIQFDPHPKSKRINAKGSI